MMEKIVKKWIDLANLPIDDPHWRSSDGEEYICIMDTDYVVLNKILGDNVRLRYICKILEEIKIEKEI
jgi:hypothetical protein